MEEPDTVTCSYGSKGSQTTIVTTLIHMSKSRSCMTARAFLKRGETTEPLIWDEMYRATSPLALYCRQGSNFCLIMPLQCAIVRRHHHTFSRPLLIAHVRFLRPWFITSVTSTLSPSSPSLQRSGQAAYCNVAYTFAVWELTNCGYTAELLTALQHGTFVVRESSNCNEVGTSCMMGAVLSNVHGNAV